MKFLRFFLAFSILLSLITICAAAKEKQNVLLLIADDLRCDLPAYGGKEAVTPHLDALAARGRVFLRAYCQQAVCNPSRASMMTGQRPDRIGITDLRTHFRETSPDIVTISQHFKSNGYQSVGIGKIFHNYHLKIEGDPQSWSVPQKYHWGNHRADLPTSGDTLNSSSQNIGISQSIDVSDEAYVDGRIASAAVQALNQLKDQPFFLAVGFWKPHLPYNAPKRWWNLYDRKKLTLPDHPARPIGAPPLAIHHSSEPRSYHGMSKKSSFANDQLLELKHGYLACMSYLDANVGQVLAELDRLGLRESTHVVFWSDNGFHLGEHEMVGKLTNYELDTRVPLIIDSPCVEHRGRKSTSIVEMVDLYPTLLELCELPKVNQPLDGKSLCPILKDAKAEVKKISFSQHPDNLTNPTAMGYSVRNHAHRYTEWRDISSGKVVARELYAYDGDLIEKENLIDRADGASHALTLASMLPPVKKNPVMQPPGIIVHHSPGSSGRFIGSPSICIASDGSYVVSHDFFGPKSHEYQKAEGRIYRSTDRGQSWKHIRDLQGFFWTGLFTHEKSVYALGLDKHHGRIVIRRSLDHGINWAEPVVLAEGQWHTAPVPVIRNHGRLWRAIEDAENGSKWGERYRARMMSAPENSDLCDPRSWDFSNPIARNATWLPENGFHAWLEGNVVTSPDGSMINLLRVDSPKLPEKAALVRVAADGKKIHFRADDDLIDFPGGCKKFTVRKDPMQSGYWAISNAVLPDEDLKTHPASMRNTVALLFSSDLMRWEIRSILLRHPDVKQHGLQYWDWQFDGDDLIAVCRTAWDDEEGGARNNHDANFLTFHRWSNFRKLSRNDDGSP